MSTHVEQREFQAETRQLLDLMIHSIYSNKDTFLRELISNASDALDKLRLESFRDKDLQVDTSDLHIELEVDKEARTLTVRDNGIGMTRDEVVDLIGTLARSGTGELRQKLREAKDAAASQELIGQFGIGFYASFMVADKVTLVTRKAGESHGNPVGIERRIHLHDRDRRRRSAGHVRHPPPQAGGCRRPSLRLHLAVEARGDRQEVLRLHRLADPYGGHAHHEG